MPQPANNGLARDLQRLRLISPLTPTLACSMPAFSRTRHAVVSLELLLALPVLIIVLLGIIELSLIYEVDKRVAYASRYGAKLASETTRGRMAPFHLANLASSGELRRRVNYHLQTAGLTAACGVILEHNACVPNRLQLDVDPGSKCSPPLETLPGGEPNGPAYARVTVCLPLQGNVADLLQSLGGFSVADATLTHSTVFRIEDDNQPPVAAFLTSQPHAAKRLATTPPTGLLPLDVPSHAGANMQLDFDAGLTTDREQPTSELFLQWSLDTDGDGRPETDGSGVNVRAAFLLPGPGEQRDYAVVLTASDACQASAQTRLVIRLRRQ